MPKMAYRNKLEMKASKQLPEMAHSCKILAVAGPLTGTEQGVGTWTNQPGSHRTGSGNQRANIKRAPRRRRNATQPMSQEVRPCELTQGVSLARTRNPCEEGQTHLTGDRAPEIQRPRTPHKGPSANIQIDSRTLD